MAVYVDSAEWKKSPKGRKSYAHMVADTMDELHQFAEKIGVKPHFFHKSSKWKHYDITAEQRELAISAGAVAVTSREVLEVSKKIS